MNYPKRLIEVDLPIKRVSAHARREKSIRHGHISTLHIWWARRPLAACRAVLCAALWPDPADPLCPPAFRVAASVAMVRFAESVRTTPKLANLCSSSWSRWNRTNEQTFRNEDIGAWGELRYALLDFIAEFANWDASTLPEFLETAQALTQAAHEALGGIPGTRPLVVDPFAGGGAIPLEALRVGADAFASDLNPVAVLLNKVVLEYIPRYGQRLADEVRTWGQWVKEQAEKELAEFYPPDSDGATPIAYLWARTIRCEGPTCGAEVPLMRSFWLAKKGKKSVAVRLVPDREKREVNFEIFYPASAKEVGDGTVKRGSATCPVCGYTTPVASVREQLKARHGGAADARMIAVVTTKKEEQGRFYHLPKERDLESIIQVSQVFGEVNQYIQTDVNGLTLVPNEPLPLMSGVFNAPLYGHTTWGSLFTKRQLLTLITLVKFIGDARSNLKRSGDENLADSVHICLALILDRQANASTSLSRWHNGGEKVEGLFARQAIPMLWDFAETNPFSDATGSWEGAVEWVTRVIDTNSVLITGGTAEQANAKAHPLPNDSIQALISDPPYYNAVPYADLSDFFYVWLKRTVGNRYPSLFGKDTSPKDEEITEMSGWDSVRYPHKNGAWFETQMFYAMAEGRRILAPSGIGTIVFAHKSTSGWESQIQAMVNAGWTITGSWPIDTEMGSRLRAMDSAALASSIHLVCRPREDENGNVTTTIGEWRDVLAELPPRVLEWMTRLTNEGVVGADAIFACLGPALEIFSRYAHVERSDGSVVALGEYLEQVWAAVSRTALQLLFKDADASGFDAPARLTAMWLWTLSSGGAETATDTPQAEDEEEEGSSRAVPTGFALEYDAARKIAQSLGIHLDTLGDLVQIKGSTARLLPVTERKRYLGLEALNGATGPRRTVPPLQMGFDSTVIGESARTTWGGELPDTFRPGVTTLDRVHQAMLLFAAGRGDALRTFLVEERVGKDDQFWQLAQALSALYPATSEEKRWVDGLLGRKRGIMAETPA